MGTIIAWVLVRDDFPGKGVVDMVIDMPFALPTIVAGLVLLTLYGPSSPLHVNIAFTRLRDRRRAAVRDAAVRGAHRATGADRARPRHGSSGRVARGLELADRPKDHPAEPVPAMLTGTGLAFARAIGEFGSVNLLSGNLPFHTEVSAVNIYNQIESDQMRPRQRNRRCC